MSRLTHLEHPIVGSPNVTDNGVAYLSEVKTLRRLHIMSESAVTGIGLKELVPLEKLRELYLGEGKLSDDGLRAVGQLKLASLKVTDAGKKELAGLTEMRELCLAGTKITDAGLPDLKRMNELRDLDLTATSVIDLAMPTLAEFANLETIFISGTNVSDKGLKQIAGLIDLQRIYMDLHGPFSGDRWRRLVIPAGIAQVRHHSLNCANGKAGRRGANLAKLQRPSTRWVILRTWAASARLRFSVATRNAEVFAILEENGLGQRFQQSLQSSAANCRQGFGISSISWCIANFAASHCTRSIASFQKPG